MAEKQTVDLMLGRLRGDVDGLLKARDDDREHLDHKLEGMEQHRDEVAETLTRRLDHHERHTTAQLSEIRLALFGRDGEEHSNAVVPTMKRINTWLDVLCWLWRALSRVAVIGGAVGTSIAALYQFGKTQGWRGFGVW
jgi:hypothetical protein